MGGRSIASVRPPVAPGEHHTAAPLFMVRSSTRRQRRFTCRQRRCAQLCACSTAAQPWRPTALEPSLSHRFMSAVVRCWFSAANSTPPPSPTSKRSCGRASNSVRSRSLSTSASCGSWARRAWRCWSTPAGVCDSGAESSRCATRRRSPSDCCRSLASPRCVTPVATRRRRRRRHPMSEVSALNRDREWASSSPWPPPAVGGPGSRRLDARMPAAGAGRWRRRCRRPQR